MKSLRQPSLHRRLTLTALVGLLFAMSLGAWGLTRAFDVAVQRGFDERLKTVLHTLVAEAENQADGSLVLGRPMGDPRFDLIYSGAYWQISNANGVLLRSRSLWDQEIPFSVGVPDGSTVFRTWTNPFGQTVRLAERDLTLPGRQDVLHFIVAGRTDDLEEEVRQFDQLMSLGVVGLMLVMGLSIAVQMRIGLQPLRGLLRDLNAVWVGRAEQVNEQLPRELKPLAVTINQLLRHDRRQTTRARDQAADLAHAIKTPLAVLRADIDQIDSSLAASMRQRLDLIDGLVRRNLARASAGRHLTLSSLVTPLYPVAEQITRLMARVYPEKNVNVHMDIDPTISLRMEREDLEEVLGNLLDNAWKWSADQIYVSAQTDAWGCEISIHDDGPGLNEQEAQQVMERHVKLDERMAGQGLGLPIARDIVEAVNGQLDLSRSPIGGLRVRIRLPTGHMP